MNVSTFAALEAAVQAAEEQWRRGDLVGALHSYADILTQRLASAQNGLTSLTAADMAIIERLADLAVPCGHVEAADALLASMVAQSERAGNYYAADYTAHVQGVRLNHTIFTREARLARVDACIAL